MNHLLLLCVILFSTVLHMGWSKGINPKEINAVAPSGTIPLVYIGGTHTKSYFAVLNEPSWAAAKEFCQGIHMNLASVENQDELDVLMNAPYNNGTSGIIGAYFHGTHRVAARDARNSNQLVWDRSNASLLNTLPFRDDIGLLPNGTFLTCGVFGVYADRRGFGFLPCNERGYNVICETSSTSALK